MKRPLALSFLAPSLLALALASCQAKPVQTPPPTPTADPTTIAIAFMQALADARYAEATLLLDPTMKSAFPQAKQREVWQSLVSQSGAFQRLGETRSERQDPYDIIYVTCVFENASLDAKVVFDSQKRITGLWFSPHQTASSTPAAYVQSDLFHEQELNIGTGSAALPGTLSIPNGQGPFPALLLVHGSGPNDRDETVGANKPFLDLAWGLASKGVAVLRYEKRTKAHPDQFAALSTTLTVKEEVVDDAVAAAALLRTQESVDPKRVFVLGHSLGGTLIPRIALADPQAAGFVILAGATRPLEDLMLIQSEYLARLDGTLSAYEVTALDDLKRQVDQVKDPGLSTAAHPQGLLGAPVSYWLDLRAYDPAEVAVTVDQPMLILQGGRDYQVGVEDLNGWKFTLSSRTDVQFKLYAELNHLFMAGDGKSTPAEYQTPGHVAEEVVNDIADWVRQH